MGNASEDTASKRVDARSKALWCCVLYGYLNIQRDRDGGLDWLHVPQKRTPYETAMPKEHI